MSATATLTPPETVRDAPTKSISARPWFFAVPIAVWKYVVGIVLCQHPVGAMLVVGWTARLMQRSALRSWWKRSALPERGVSFGRFAATLPGVGNANRVPNWCLGESTSIESSTPARPARHLFGSLVENLQRGFSGALSIFICTLPATSLWLYSWVLGWNISFFKLYEQSNLGASLGLLGILLFIVAMLYVPLAHARQAATGEWRAFFDLRFNWRLARRHPAVMLPTAIAFVLASGVVMLLRMAPYFLGSEPELANLSTEALREWLENYHLFAGAILFPAYVLVWLAVSKSYARAVWSEFAHDPTRCQLRGTERVALNQLQVEPHKTPSPNRFVRSTSWTVGRISTLASLALIALAWFAVAAEVYVAQFFNYLPGTAWLNHPLVLLPWIKTIPPGLLP